MRKKIVLGLLSLMLVSCRGDDTSVTASENSISENVDSCADGACSSLLEVEGVNAYSNELLKVVQNDLPGSNLILAGVSEATIASYIFRGSSLHKLKRYDFSPNGELQIGLSSNWLKSRLDSDYGKVEIDAVEKVVRVTASMSLQVSASHGSRTVAAYRDFIVEVTARPSLVSGVDQALQLEFLSFRIIETADAVVTDEAAVLNGFTTVDEMEEALSSEMDNLASDTGPFAGVFGAFVQASTKQRFFGQKGSFELLGRGINCESVPVAGRKVGYLFAILDVRGLNMPAPCFCEEPHSSLALSRSFGLEQSFEFVSGASSHLKVEAPEYADILEEAQKSTLTFSQGAFKEIIRSYVNFSIKDQSGKRRNGIEAKAGFWATLRPNEQGTRILADGIRVGVDLAGEGRASAGVRFLGEFDGPTIERAIGLQLQAKDIAVTLKPQFSSTTGGGEFHAVNLVGDVSLGEGVKVDFEGGLQQLHSWW